MKGINKMKNIEIQQLPCVLFGQEPAREVRLVASPWTTGSEIAIVHVVLPPGGISEGHMHPDVDEYILFDIGGLCVIDGQLFPVKPGSVILASKGERHECRNNSPDRNLNLFCIFTPAFKPYGAYPDLIEKTKNYLESIE